MVTEGIAVTWTVSRERFLEKYFPADICDKKEMELLVLKQGNVSVGEYAAKFEELARYYTPYQVMVDDRSKCVKFEDGLRPEIKQTISYQEIKVFPTLMNKCRIFEDAYKSKVTSFKGLDSHDSRKTEQKDKGKQCYAPAGRDFK